MPNGHRFAASRMTAMKRARIVAHWATIALVGVAMAAFIVFEVLDLDGSNLRRPATGSLVTTDVFTDETERFLVRATDGSSVPGAEPAVNPPSVFMQVVGTLARVTLHKTPTHRAAAHRQAWKDHAFLQADATADDPA
jgi:hypothetical protein